MIKRKIHQILDVSKNTGDLSWHFDLFIRTLIVLNVLAVVLESVASIGSRFQEAFYWFEVFSVVVFTVEYVLRIWTANLVPGYEKPVLGNIRYAFTGFALIDLLAFLPFYLPFFGVELRMLRVLRMFRVFRLFKVARYVDALSFIVRVFDRKREKLVITLIFTGFLLLLASSFMYFAENEAQPDVFTCIPEEARCQTCGQTLKTKRDEV
jgi:voltage-gated potassium channel